MRIKKLHIFRDTIKTSICFDEKTTILNVGDNQFGKTTIIYSILYCLGLGDNIFNTMSIKPTLVKLFIGDSEIVRAKGIWTVDGKIVETSKGLSENLGTPYPMARLSGGYAPIKIAELMSYTTLIQKRETRSGQKVWPGMIASRISDVNRYATGGNYNEYLKLSRGIFKIQKQNKKIRRNYKLKNYIGTESVTNLEEFIDFEKRGLILSERIRALRLKFRKNRLIVKSFETEVEYNKVIELFTDGMESLNSLKGVPDKTELREYIKDKFNSSTQKSISISEYELASSENLGILKEIQELELGIKHNEEESYKEIDKLGLESKLITYALAKVSKQEILPTFELGESLKQIELALDSKTKKQESDSIEILESFNIQLADSGIGQVALFLIDAMAYAKVTGLPIIIDSADEVFSTGEKISDAEMHKIINIIKDSKLQIILTTTKVVYTDETNKNVINIADKILEVSHDYKLAKLIKKQGPTN